MRKHYIKHEKLRDALSEIYTQGADVESQTIDAFENELRHSSLIVAADLVGGSLEFRLFPRDGKRYGVFFTDMAEFGKVFHSGNCESYEIDFIYYSQMVREGMIDGFILNPATEAFLIDEELFSRITDLPDYIYNMNDAYSADELKEVNDNVDNGELEDFISDVSNHSRYEELFDLISKSHLLSLRLSEEDLSGRFSGGVASIVDCEPMIYSFNVNLGGHYASLFTCEDKLKDISSDLHRYYQLVNFSQFVGMVLNGDLDGIIINPYEEHVMITRDVLLEFYSHVKETCNDSRLNSAIFHLFPIG